MGRDVNMLRDDVFFALILLLVNLLTTVFYIIVLKDGSRTKAFFELPVLLQKSFVILFVGPLFVSPFVPQFRLHMSSLFAISIGAVLIAEGFCMILFSFLKIGVIPSLRKSTGLITSGTYGIVRHPIYSGTLSIYLGLALSLNALVSLCYFPVSVFLYYLTTVYEERGLVAAYPEEYPSYQTRVKGRIVPSVL